MSMDSIDVTIARDAAIAFPAVLAMTKPYGRANGIEFRPAEKAAIGDRLLVIVLSSRTVDTARYAPIVGDTEQRSDLLDPLQMRYKRRLGGTGPDDRCGSWCAAYGRKVVVPSGAYLCQ